MHLINRNIVLPFGIFICFMAIGIIEANPNAEVPGVLVGSLQTRAISARSTSCQNQYGTICSNCNTILTCLGTDPPAQNQSCSSIDPARPYCVNNRCSNVADPNLNCNTGTTCTAGGYFPNPTDCTQYFLCAGPSGASQLYQCPTNYVYNPLTYRCKRRFWLADCIQVNCAANPNRYIAYRGNPAYYTYCMNINGVSTPIMFRCPDTENYEFNQVTESCDIKCRAEGRIPDANNCAQYWECYRVGFRFVSQLQRCVNGYIYNDTVKKCVVGQCPVVTTTTEAATTTTDTATESTATTNGNSSGTTNPNSTTDPSATSDPTGAPTTEAPTTEEPTTVEPTTEEPTTE